jgi:hypothetical protein
MPSKSRSQSTTEFMSDAEVRQALSLMDGDSSYKTDPGYSSSDTLYPAHQVPFIERHVQYLQNHPKVNPEHYLANLRIMTRIRRS